MLLRTCRAGLRASLACALLVSPTSPGCGRAFYRPNDGGLDAMIRVDARANDDAEIDARVAPDAPASDVPDAVTSDAPLASDAAQDAMSSDAFVDPGCADVLADPAAAPDSELWRCALADQLGRCSVGDADRKGCTGCACEYYATNPGWDCPGVCATDITPTGCIQFRSGSLAVPRAPFDCGAAATVEELGACMMRHELLAGHCAPCTCP